MWFLNIRDSAKCTRVALYLQDAHDLRDGLDYVRYAEERGFEAVWQAESRLVRDAIVPMAAYAAVTERIKVGSGVINNWTRNIGLLASTFLTLDDLAPDRMICGIGAWWDPLARNVGIERKETADGHARNGDSFAPPAQYGAGDLSRQFCARRWD
jgi:5,10-methylenetetrahydromethanopterin reductase